MPEQHSNTQAVEVAPSPGAAHASSVPGILDVSPPMMILTWITFIVMTFILYKVAWKPILRALSQRENSIRQALEDAEKARAETAALEVKGRQILRDAQAQAQATVSEARTAAEETARAIEKRSREEGRALVDDARREILHATEQARTELRHETAELVVILAGKVLRKNMDTATNRDLAEELMKEM